MNYLTILLYVPLIIYNYTKENKLFFNYTLYTSYCSCYVQDAANEWMNH